MIHCARALHMQASEPARGRSFHMHAALVPCIVVEVLLPLWTLWLASKKPAPFVLNAVYVSYCLMVSSILSGCVQIDACMSVLSGSTPTLLPHFMPHRESAACIIMLGHWSPRVAVPCISQCLVLIQDVKPRATDPPGAIRPNSAHLCQGAYCHLACEHVFHVFSEVPLRSGHLLTCVMLLVKILLCPFGPSMS